MKNISGFLQTEIKNSIEAMVVTIAKKIKLATTLDSILAVMVTAVVTALRGLGGREEEIRLLGLLVVCHFGGKGLEVPEAISKLLVALPESKPAPTPVLLPAAPKSSAPAKQVAVTPMIMKPVPATVPARVLGGDKAPPTPEASFSGLLGFLRGIVNGKNVPWEGVRSLVVKSFRAGIKPSQSEWELLFAAMKVANEKGQHIVNNDAGPFVIFSAAPVELVDDLLFGQDGLVSSVTTEISKQTGQLPSWLCAKASIVLDAIEAVDLAGVDGLDDVQEEKKVNQFLNAIEDKNGPQWLIEKGETIWNSGNADPKPSVSTAPLGEGARIKGDLNKIANGRQHQPTATLESAKAESREFLAAVATVN